MIMGEIAFAVGLAAEEVEELKGTLTAQQF